MLDLNMQLRAAPSCHFKLRTSQWPRASDVTRDVTVSILACGAVILPLIPFRTPPRQPRLIILVPHKLNHFVSVFLRSDIGAWLTPRLLSFHSVFGSLLRAGLGLEKSVKGFVRRV